MMVEKTSGKTGEKKAKKKKGQKLAPQKPRENACTPRVASRLELFGGASSRDSIKLGDLADVCVDGHGYHWVLVTRIERADIGSPLPPKPAQPSRPLTKVEAIAARIAARNATRKAGSAKEAAEKVATSKGLSAAISIGARAYTGFLSNDPSPACTGCRIGREFTFRHDAIKEVKRAARGLTVEDAVRTLKRFIRDTEHRSRLSSDHADISMELGINGRTSWHEQDYFADEGVPLTP